MSMETPKISVGMIAEQFSAMSVKSRQWYEKSLREAVLYSLVVYYEARLKSRFVPVLDPWEGMTVANYNYRLVLAEVERKLPMWVSNLPVESENASALYAELLGKAERRRTLRRRYRSVWWFDLRIWRGIYSVFIIWEKKRISGKYLPEFEAKSGENRIFFRICGMQTLLDSC